MKAIDLVLVALVVVCRLAATAHADGPTNWQEVRSFTAPAFITGLAYDGEQLFPAGFDTDRIYALDPASGSVLWSFQAPRQRGEGLTFDGRYLWSADTGEDRVYKLNPRTGAVLDSIPYPGQSGNGLAWHAGSLYLGATWDDRIYELDPATGFVRNSISFPSESSGIGGNLTFVASDLYFSDYVTGSIYSLDPRDGTVRGSFDSGILHIEGMTYGGGSLFISDGRARNIHVLVPEPATLLLLGAGGPCLLAYGWRKRRRR